MSKKFTQIPVDTFSKLQLNAGVLIRGAEGFIPETGTIAENALMGATSGGLHASCVPSFTDFGEDIDNCPKNIKELKILESWECKISGTFLTIDTASAKEMLGAADVDTTDTTKVIPRRDLSQEDFFDVWLVCDYSDKNGKVNGGFVAIHLMNALSTAGFDLQTSDTEKGKFTAEFTGHVSIDTQDVVPMEFFIKAGTAETSGTTVTPGA